MERIISFSDFCQYSKWCPRDRREAYMYIDQATRYVENYLNYPLGKAEHKDKFTVYQNIDGWILDCQPVLSVGEMTINGVGVEDYDVHSYGVDYGFKDGDEVVIEYTAGYVPFTYSITSDTKVLPNKEYFRKVGDNYVEAFDLEVDDDIVGEVYDREENYGEGALDEIIKMVVLRLATVLHTQSGGNVGTLNAPTGRYTINLSQNDIDYYCRPLNGLRRYPI